MKILLKKIRVLLFLIVFIPSAFAQNSEGELSGIVKDLKGQALPGVTVMAAGTSIGTTTNPDGSYTIRLAPGNYKINYSFVGFKTQTKNATITSDTKSTINIILTEAAEGLQEVVVVGSRAEGRTKLETPVPVDVIDIKGMMQSNPQLSISQILNFVAPSFSSNAQSIQDGTDHIDPASLRGMGVDQVLVLLNGKRLHQSSLVNFQIGPGRGQVGTDLNQIPVSSIDRIEILRDGAAAQYGSDAIAGVINIILKSSTEKVEVTATTGAYFTGDQSLKDQGKTYDGAQLLTTVNYGIPVGTQGGFINFSGSFEDRARTNRVTNYEGTIFRDYNATNGAGNQLYDLTQFSKDITDDNALAYFQANNLTGADITEEELARRGLSRKNFNMQIGQAQVRDGKGFVNSVIPMGDNFELYAFGGISFRQGRSSGYFRLPSSGDRYLPEVYPNGFLPHINSKISDKNLAVGIRGKAGNWNVDFSNIYGSNRFLFIIDQSINFSQLTASQTRFDAGGHEFGQNTTNFDISRKFDMLSGINLAFGAEHRYENFQIIPGEEASWKNYGLDASGNPTIFLRTPELLQSSTGADSLAVSTSIRPGGSQVFPGFKTAVNQYRNSYAIYADVEADITESLLLGGAVRHENYSDFGGTTNFKAVSRYKLGSNWTVRASYNTGFRAPSLHQIYFSTTTTQLVNGTLSEVGIFSNDSKLAQILGIPSLKAEQSYGFTGGVTGKFLNKFTLSLDYFNIRVKDRIVFTDAISGDPEGSEQDKQIYDLLLLANASVAQFFVNAIDTKTEGVDAILTFNQELGNGKLRIDLSSTFSQTRLDGKVKVPSTFVGRENFFFPNTSKVILESISPVQKQNLSINYGIGNFNFFLRNVRFGGVIDPNVADDEGRNMSYSPKIITDVAVSYSFNPSLQLTVGSNNLLDIYPDKVDKNKFPDGYDNGRFRYQNAASQFGYNGRFLFARLNITL